MAYNVAEGVIAVWFGAEADSISLVGFGLDSYIEVAAAIAVFWRLSHSLREEDGEAAERRERRVHQFVGATFVGLALYVSVQSVWNLWTRSMPEASLIGILLALASLIVMPSVAWGKLRVAKKLSSTALRAEAKETLACSYLSLVLLLGLGANAAWGWWWADPLAALAMIPWLVKEGLEGLRGDDCCD